MRDEGREGGRDEREAARDGGEEKRRARGRRGQFTRLSLTCLLQRSRTPSC